MLCKAVAWFLVLLTAVPAAAQSLTVTPESNALMASGGIVVLRVQAAYVGPATLDLEITLPSRWYYVSGAGEPLLRPATGAAGLLKWSVAPARSGPIEFSFLAAYPGGSFRASVTGSLLLSQPAGATRITAVPVAFGPPGAPTIAIQPAGVFTTVESALAGFNVVASGTPPLSYQWRKDGANLPGATTAHFGYAQAAPSQSGRYEVIVTNALGSVTSDAVTLTVPALDPNPGPVPPVLYVQPAGTTAPAGGAAAFSVLALSNSTLTYQWLKSGLPLRDATGAALILPDVQAADAGSYAVVVTNASGTVTSSAATLAVGPAPPAGTPPAIVTAPVSQIVPEGMPARLGVEASGTPPLTYQWLHYGVPIAGATAAELEVATTSISAAGAYRAVVSNALGAATSPVATVAFGRGGIGLSGFGSLPTARTVAGGSARFNAPALGSPPLTYQWYKDESPLPGATAASLEFSQVIPSDAGRYRVEIANPWGSTRYVAQLIVEPAPVAPTFLFQPILTTSSTVDSAARLTASVDGTAPFSFQWLKNGRLLEGATNATLEFPALQPGDAGSYSVGVTNAAGSATSSTYPLTLRSPEFSTLGTGPTGPPALLRPPRALTIREGAAAAFSVMATATIPPLSYQWRKDGRALPGATQASFSLPLSTAADAGDYSVLVWNPRGLVASASARLAVSGRTRAGTYLGNMTSPNGAFPPIAFAVYLPDDDAGVFLGGRADGHERAFTIDASGLFRFGRGATSGSIAGANAAYSIEGTVTPDGRVTGTYYHPLSGARGEFSGNREPRVGATETLAGFYRAGAAHGAATGTFLMSAMGSVFFVMNAPGMSDFGPGTIDASGRLLAATEFNRMAGTLRTADGQLTVDFTPLDGRAPFTLIGARDGRSDRERLINLSTRATAGPAGADMLIAGFMLAGTEPKQVLIRAIGPTLAQFDVAGPLPAARLELFSGSRAIASNPEWDPKSVSAAPLISAAAQRVGAFALPRGSKDAALLTTLEPGSYTAQVTGLGQTTGVALVEIYDATESPSAAERQVINLSTRAVAGTGANTLVAGFVVSGSVPRRVLIRGIGPGLAAFGVAGTLTDPRLQLYRQDGTLLASNDDWDSAGNAATVNAAIAQTGAFALAPVSKDAALVINLPPGGYTVHVSGNGPTPGVALVEIFEVP